MSQTTDSSLSKWLASTNDSIGMLSFATIIYMSQSSLWRIELHLRSGVRLMIYLDAVAWLIVYICNCCSDLLPLCSQQNIFYFLADFLWSFKDAVKYGYVAWRCLVVHSFRESTSRKLAYLLASISLGLYWLLMAQVYSFDASNGCSPHFDSKMPLLTLYIFWTLIDFTCAIMIIKKLSKNLTALQKANVLDFTDNTRVLRRLKRRELVRLAFVSIGMCAVSVSSIVATSHPELVTYRVGSIVFVYCQLILVSGSQKDGATDDKPTTTVPTIAMTGNLSRSHFSKKESRIASDNIRPEVSTSSLKITSTLPPIGVA
ncbi:hypothetical protein BC830DRAFT_490124 [Chytriomyces sp. MP71]|nr:hypothetical protein BC830DRAFT_490124 [Chytriomyces sp. MP71]